MDTLNLFWIYILEQINKFHGTSLSAIEALLK